MPTCAGHLGSSWDFFRVFSKGEKMARQAGAFRWLNPNPLTEMRGCLLNTNGLATWLFTPNGITLNERMVLISQITIQFHLLKPHILNLYFFVALILSVSAVIFSVSAHSFSFSLTIRAQSASFHAVSAVIFIVCRARVRCSTVGGSD